MPEDIEDNLPEEHDEPEEVSDDQPEPDAEDDDTPEDDRGDNDSDDGRSRKETSRNRNEPSSRNEDLERRLAAAEARANEAYETASSSRNSSAGIAEQQQRDADRRALLTPEERLREDADRALHQIRQEAAKAQFINQDAQDRRNFIDYVSKNPIAKKYEKEVEERLESMRKKGSNVAREDLLAYVAGKEFLKSAGRSSNSAQKKRGEANVARARTNSTNARSDVSNTRRTGSTAKERLAGIQI